MSQLFLPSCAFVCPFERIWPTGRQHPYYQQLRKGTGISDLCSTKINLLFSGDYGRCDPLRFAIDTRLFLQLLLDRIARRCREGRATLRKSFVVNKHVCLHWSLDGIASRLRRVRLLVSPFFSVSGINVHLITVGISRKGTKLGCSLLNSAPKNFSGSPDHTFDHAFDHVFDGSDP
jgi:hypothetical protein